MSVLVIDDSDDLWGAMEPCIRAAGEDVVERCATASDGLFTASSRDYDLLIVDVSLPDLSGIEVTRLLRMRPRTAAVPVIQISGLDLSEPDRLSALAAGADLFLARPISAPELAAVVRALLARHRREKQLAHETSSILEEADRLFCLGLSLVQVANDLAQPLSVVAGAVATLRRRHPKDPLATALDGAHAEILELVDRVVARASDDSAAPVGPACDVNTVIRSQLFLRAVDPFVRDNIGVVIRLSPSLPLVAADRRTVASHVRQGFGHAAEALRSAPTAGDLVLEIVTFAEGPLVSVEFLAYAAGKEVFAKRLHFHAGRRLRPV